MKEVKLSPLLHRGVACIKIEFAKNDILQNCIKTIPGRLWSQTHGCWYIPKRDDLISELEKRFKGKAHLHFRDLLDEPLANAVKIFDTRPKPFQVSAKLSEEAFHKIREFKIWLRSKRYSDSTIGTYCDALKIFLRYYPVKPLDEITNQDIILFNNHYILENKLSVSFQNQVVNAIKLFFKTIENRKLELDLIHRPKRPKLLPNVLSKEEVKLILNVHNNIKHRAMLSLIYSCGLRRGELLNLKLSDIDSKRGLVIIRQGKGRKDRIAPLPDKMLVMLREYFIICKPKEWLFEGQGGRGQYDESSLVSVLKQGLEKSKINKPVTLHWLRHSYATHLLESGTDLRYIQEILGHSRSTTTEIYTHVSTKGIQKVISPFETL